MKLSRLGSALLLTALALSFSYGAPAADVVTSKHLFKKNEQLNLEPRTCNNGMPPIIIAYHADLAKRGDQTIPFHEYYMRDKTRYYTVTVEENTEGLITQFCDHKSVKPFFDSLKTTAVESASK